MQPIIAEEHWCVQLGYDKTRLPLLQHLRAWVDNLYLSNPTCLDLHAVREGNY